MVEQEKWTTLKVLNWTKDFLLSKGIANARLEAEWLLCAVTRLDRVGLYLNYDKPLNEVELAEYRSMVTRRARREPLQHILGTEEFYGLEYEVTADVLIPRHDTEVLVSQALKLHPDALSVLDIGTGSGCIAVTLQKQLTQAKVTATDISLAALAVARRNAEKHEANIEFLEGSLFVPVGNRSFDLVVSNPPYIPTSDICNLEQEVRDYDPLTALDGGRDGLEIYKKLIPAAGKHLNQDGWLLVEIGFAQAADVVQLFRDSCLYREPVVARDTSEIERVVAAQIKENA
jgi:release factor glutamine methyltransferase